MAAYHKLPCSQVLTEYSANTVPLYTLQNDRDRRTLCPFSCATVYIIFVLTWIIAWLCTVHLSLLYLSPCLVSPLHCTYVCTCPHSLSMVHDFQQNDCPDQGGVMAPKQGKGLQMFEWSNCSASELRRYRIAGGTKCLMETDPANAIIKPSFPGQEFNLTYQCKAMFGDQAIVCPWWPHTVSNPCAV